MGWKDKIFGRDNPLAEVTRDILGDDVGNAVNYINPITWGVGVANWGLGQFSSGDGLQGAINRSEAARRNAILGQLYGQSTSGEIDRESKDEIVSLLKAGNIGAAETVVRDARAGTLPKYKARMASQKMYETLIDQPGTRQTRETGVASLLMGNQFTGRGRG